jgi:hypothetical protein
LDVRCIGAREGYRADKFRNRRRRNAPLTRSIIAIAARITADAAGAVVLPPTITPEQPGIVAHGTGAVPIDVVPAQPAGQSPVVSREAEHKVIPEGLVHRQL